MEQTLYNQIAQSTAHRKSRDDNAAFVLRHGLGNELISLALDTANKNHFKACWTLELVLEHNLDLLTPRLAEFCDNLPHWANDSALRSVSKICMFCAKRLKQTPDFLSEKQILQITEACFQWVISDEKVAAKAYAIFTLYETGKKLDWVYPELIPVLQHGFPDHSPAYQSVARKVLGKIMVR